MSKLSESCAYVVMQLSPSRSVDKAKLSKILFLSDLEAMIYRHAPITEATWLKLDCGPSSPDLTTLVTIGHEGLVLTAPDPSTGSNWPRVHLEQDIEITALDSLETEILDAMIDFCTSRSWPEFVQEVARTYPLKRTGLGQVIDLSSALAALLRDPRFRVAG